MDATMFDGSDFYSLRTDEEALGHRTQGAALKAWAREQVDPAAALLDQTLTVYAWRREDPPNASWRKMLAERMAETAEEEWADWYGDPDGDDFDVGALSKAVETVLAAHIATRTVWHCRVVANREYTAAEVAAILTPAPAAKEDDRG